ncbi:uncharacterized protein LOC131207674 [Anopheles bellator]|uniref:uncharacterized protein LOC131207674 n=1 Tax=Anopheles bellator TaxID=139047 RepID=UPI002649897D|nr:uncharacterized protein LOC131207674 [Anopheles bellator]
MGHGAHRIGNQTFRRESNGRPKTQGRTARESCRGSMADYDGIVTDAVPMARFAVDKMTAYAKQNGSDEASGPLNFEAASIPVEVVEIVEFRTQLPALGRGDSLLFGTSSNGAEIRETHRIIGNPTASLSFQEHSGHKPSPADTAFHLRVGFTCPSR